MTTDDDELRAIARRVDAMTPDALRAEHTLITNALNRSGVPTHDGEGVPLTLVERMTFATAAEPEPEHGRSELGDELVKRTAIVDANLRALKSLNAERDTALDALRDAQHERAELKRKIDDRSPANAISRHRNAEMLEHDLAEAYATKARYIALIPEEFRNTSMPSGVPTSGPSSEDLALYIASLIDRAEAAERVVTAVTTVMRVDSEPDIEPGQLHLRVSELRSSFVTAVEAADNLRDDLRTVLAGFDVYPVPEASDEALIVALEHALRTQKEAT